MARELIAVAIALVAGCHRDPPASQGEPAPAASSATASAPLAAKPFYRVDRGPQGACASGSTCEAQLVLTALGDYHVNKDYPFKFVADPAAAQVPVVEGQGAFAQGDAQHGTLTIKFRPAAPGSAAIHGTFKLSVCNDNNCEIESPKLEFAVPVS